MAAIKAQMRALQTEALKASTDPANLSERRWRNAANAMSTASRVYRDALSSSGMWNVEQQRITSQTEVYTERLKAQKVALGEMIAKRKVLKATYQDQLRMQRMEATLWGTDSRGRQIFDVASPKIVSAELNNINRKLGFTRALIASASTQMVNLGKNTQWTGRQLMVGFTMPTLFAGAAAGAQFYKGDKEIVRIQKVYDTMRQGEGRLAELAQLRADAMNTATMAADKYAASMTDTLQVQAELAATGVKGIDLQKATNEVMRISQLGELDRQAAVDTTIALQNSFNMSTQELTKTFNFFNATENATSLSLKDISEAVPRAASSMAALNVSAEEMTVLMVAMRERGVDAAEGANALKSATTRIINPVKRAVEFYERFNINIEQMSKRTGGNLFKFLKELATETQNLSDQEKAAGIANLFGTYQFNRLNAAVSGLGEAMAGTGDKTSQTARAVELMGANSKELAKLADKELGQVMDSASGKFKRAVELIKVQLFELGEPFLKAGTWMLNLVTEILKALNKMPDWLKDKMAIAAIIIAAVGPLIMVGGLVMNLIGNFGKMTAKILGLATSFDILTKSERLANIHNQMVERGMTSAERQTERYRMELNALAQSFQMAGNAARKMMKLPVSPGMPIGNAPMVGGQNLTDAQWARMQDMAYAEDMRRGGQRDYSTAGKSGFAAWSAQWSRYDDVNKAHAEALEMDKQITKEKAKQARFGNTIAGAATVATAAMGVQMITSNEIVDNFAQWAMAAALIGPAVKMGADFFKGAFTKAAMSQSVASVKGFGAKMGDAAKNSWAASRGMLETANNSRKVNGVMRTFGGGIKAAGAGLAALATTSIGIGAAIAAAGFAAYKLWQYSQNIDKDFKEIYANAEGLAEIYGYEFQEGAVMDPKTGKNVNEQFDRVKKIREEYGALVREIQDTVPEQEKFNIALMQGYKVITSGGSADQARQATRDALYAAEEEAKAKKIWLRFKGEIDFGSSKGIAEIAQRTAQLQLDAAISATDNKSFGEGFVDGLMKFATLGTGDFNAPWIEESFNKASKDAAVAGEAAGVGYFKGFQQAMSSGEEGAAVQVLVSFQKKINEINKRIEQAQADGNDQLANQLKDTRRIIAEGFARGAGFDETSIKKMGLDSYVDALKLMKELGYDLNRSQTRTLEKAAGTWSFLDETMYDITGQFIDAANSQQVLGNEMENTTSKAEKQRIAAENLRREFMKDWSPKDFAMGIMTDTRDDVLDKMQAEFDRNESRALERVKNSADARMESFDDETERLEDGWDRRGEQIDRHFETRKRLLDRAFNRENRKLESQMRHIENATNRRIERMDKEIEQIQNVSDKRIEAIDKAIKKEQKAEDIRQSIFEAEQRRIDRLNDSMNRNIDFAQALNEGDLDEAARIMNDAAAAEQKNALEDADRKAAQESERRIDRMERKQDRIQKAAERRVKRLEARQERLKKQSERRIKALEKEQRKLERQHDKQMRMLDRLEEKQKRQFERAREMAQKAREQKRKLLEKEVNDVVKAEEKKWAARKRNMDKAMEELKAFVPRSEKELAGHIKRVGKKYDLFGKGLTKDGDRWAKAIGNSLTQNIKRSKNTLQNEVNWEGAGKQIARKLVKGAFGISLNQFKNWMISDNPQRPSAGGGNRKKRGGRDYSANADPGRRTTQYRHAGGPAVGGAGSRVGYAQNARTFPSEIPTTLKRGEYVMRDKAVNKYGVDFMNRLNDGKVNFGTGGGVGMAGIAGAVMSEAFKYATLMMGNNVVAAHYAAMMPGGKFGAPKAGVYGNDGVVFSQEQLRNAAIIASVGSSMGMSARDIKIGLMTAMQESMLRNVNYGDRDSLGLFQQRPSQGWGTPQQVRDPEYAARKFFQGLKGVEGRDSMPMTLAAQAVQRSAYPYAYAKWADEAADIYRNLTSIGVSGFIQGKGGLARPVDRRFGLTQGIHGSPPAVDFGVPVGSPVYAAASGRVASSYDIRGYEPRAAHGGNGYKSYGRVITIAHDGGGSTLYAHLSQRSVRKGQRVLGGAVIGRSGDTGYSTGPHLHFGATPMSPMKFVSLQKGAQDIRWDNTLANLHKGEAVLTKDINNDFKRGVKNFAEGGHNEYTIDVKVTQPNASADEIANAIMRKIKYEEGRQGHRRTVKRGTN